MYVTLSGGNGIVPFGMLRGVISLFIGIIPHLILEIGEFH